MPGDRGFECGAMWHEARRSERKVHDLMDAARRRAQRRAVFLAKRRGDPQQSLQIAGTRCRIHHDAALYQATQDQQGLSHPAQPSSASKGTYSQVGFAYEGDGKEECQILDSDEEEDDEDDKDSSSDYSEDDEMEIIAKEYGVKRYNWLVYMDRKAKEEEKRQKEVAKGDPAMRKLSRKERRKASQQEREREKEAARMSGSRLFYHDPYREPRRSPTYEAYSRSRISRSRSPSMSPSYSRRYDRGRDDNLGRRSKGRASMSKIEYITEFGGTMDGDDHKLEGIAPPPSPPSQADLLNRPSSGRILEALHMDPAASATSDWERTHKESKPSVSTSSALAKLSKVSTTTGPVSKPQQGERKETPQERLKRIMSKQLNKQIKKDTVVEMTKRREQERQRQEKLAETSRIAKYRRHSESHSRSRSPLRYRHSRSRSPRRHYTRSRSPRVRSRSRY